jgi:hypothetical protein
VSGVEDLVQWLTGQLDEDQQAAEDALKRTTTTRRRIGGQWVEDTVQPPEWRRSAWSPARVLREIDAKRATLGFLVAELDRTDSPWWYDDKLERLLKLLALPYADRPGYREEWRP